MSAYTPLGRTGLTASRLGFGAYRVDDRTPEHGAALERALRSGINLIDTSTNYTDGRSERRIGGTLRELAGAGALSRDEVIVVSKVGYLQGRNLEMAQQREMSGDPFPETVKIQDGLWHCIHPSFIRDQLQRSLDRLELESLDVYLLHNPEYFLADAARRGEPVEPARSEFYRRVRAAFEALEAEVEGGRIAWYGVSSNTVVAPPDDAEATSLTRMLEAARAAGGGEHRFAVLQLPMNLFEPGAALEAREGERGEHTVLEHAEEEEIAVLVNRPLNAFAGGALVRLADVREPGDAPPIENALDRVAELEAGFRDRIAPTVRGSGAADAERYFRWAEQLRALRPRLRGLPDWSSLQAQVDYTVRVVAGALDRALAGDEEGLARWHGWRDRYLEQLDRLFRAMRHEAAERSRARNASIRAALDPLLPEDRRDATLSRVALWTVASTPGVTSVLNGMRRPEYVDDARGILEWEPLPDPLAIYRAMREVELSG